MGTSPGLGVSEADSKMRAFAFVLLAAVAINADADADAYTVGQVAHGLTNSGVVTGVDYGHGVVSGYGAIGSRTVPHVAGVHPVNTVAGVYSAHPVTTVAGVYNTHAVPAVHAGVSHVPAVYASRPVHTVTTHAVPAVHSVGVPAVHSVYSGYNTHLYGKREAEAEPYTIAQVHAGLPVVNAYATGHPHNVGYTTNMVSPFHHVYSGYGHFGFHG